MMPQENGLSSLQSTALEVLRFSQKPTNAIDSITFAPTIEGFTKWI